MKAVILAGGLGTRISEETQLRPKPMIEIGGKPILWHIMKTYAAHGVCDFIICCGYKGYIIKEYFANYGLHLSDVTIDLATGSRDVHQTYVEPWRVTLIDTGEHTMTGGRLKRVASYLTDDEPFCFTYGDGVSDVDITALIEHHKRQGRLATVTAIRPPSRFGQLTFDENRVTGFAEKPIGEDIWINGGYFVLSKRAISYIAGDDVPWEREPLETIASAGELSGYKHHGFWHPMDTLRDKLLLEELWAKKECPWRIWR